MPWKKGAFQEFPLPETHPALSRMTQRAQWQKIRAAICCGHCWSHQEGQASATASCVPQHPQHSTLSQPRAMTCPSLVGPPLSPALPLGHPHAFSLVWGQQDHADCTPTGTGDPASPRPTSVDGEVHSDRDPCSEEGWGHGGPVLSPNHLCFLKGCISKGARGIPLLPPVPTRQGK